jgi:hypothetical protein
VSIPEASAPACEEEARLRNLCAVTKLEYNRVLELIALRIGELNTPTFEVLVNNARKPMEEAQEALKRHIAEHGC